MGIRGLVRGVTAIDLEDLEAEHIEQADAEAAALALGGGSAAAALRLTTREGLVHPAHV